VIHVVDIGLGNIGSAVNMIRKAGGRATITRDVDEIHAAEKLLLPGVGSFDTAIQRMEGFGLVPALVAHARRGRPLLGICLGMQLLAERSEEGVLPGLGLIPGSVKRFTFGSGPSALRIPHMGWNRVRICRPHRLLDGLDERARFYFVHSFHLECTDESDALLKTEYGYEFTSGVQRGNVMGVQFHPEKSHRFGMQLLKNFIEL
jgi:glutamine amidotransferase